MIDRKIQLLGKLFRITDLIIHLSLYTYFLVIACDLIEDERKTIASQWNSGNGTARSVVEKRKASSFSFDDPVLVLDDIGHRIEFDKAYAEHDD